MICLRINNLCQMQFVCCHGKKWKRKTRSFLSEHISQTYSFHFSLMHTCSASPCSNVYGALKQNEIFDDCWKYLLNVADWNVRVLNKLEALLTFFIFFFGESKPIQMKNKFLTESWECLVNFGRRTSKIKFSKIKFWDGNERTSTY